MVEGEWKSDGVPEGTPSPALPAEGSSPADWDSFVGGAKLPRGVPPQTKRRRLTLPEVMPPLEVSPQRRLLILDTWRRSGLPAGDFAVLVGVSKHTLYAAARYARLRFVEPIASYRKAFYRRDVTLPCCVPSPLADMPSPIPRRKS